jgi:protein-disulfide isomerase
MRTLLFLLPAALLVGQTLVAQTPAVKTHPLSTTPKTFPSKEPTAVTNYKESGSPNAPVTIEAYTDYECPHCARFYKQFMPQFTADYIATGKVRFVHRDFPLTQHQHAQLAARFADAAGEVGYYDVVVKQIFDTQNIWSMGDGTGQNTGNIDAEVAKVVPPGAMQKIRELVKSDPRIDASISHDVSMAMSTDHVPSTPTLVIVTKSGKRELDSEVMDVPYNLFKKYLDAKIAGQ